MTREGYDERWPRRIERAVVVIIVVVVVVVSASVQESRPRELNPGLKKKEKKEKLLSLALETMILEDRPPIPSVLFV